MPPLSAVIAANFDGGMPSLASRLSRSAAVYTPDTPNQRTARAPLPHAAVDPWEFGDLAVAVQGQISRVRPARLAVETPVRRSRLPSQGGLTIRQPLRTSRGARR